MERRNILSVSSYISITDGAIKKFGVACVEGEISEIKNYSHMYFKIKDEQSSLDCIMFASYVRSLPFTPTIGQKVIVSGSGSIYSKNGSFKLSVTSMELAGIGNLIEQVRLLGNKLREEGVFSQNKRAIPTFINKVGVITSHEGSVLHDIINVLEKRNKAIDIIVYPASVQGENAPQELIRALNVANTQNICDVLIIGRGGGSYSDLMAFNDEVLVRAIANSKIKIISAVGHEPDFTLADEAADMRASTPTHAATIVSQIELSHIKDSLDSYQEQIKSNLYRLFDTYEQKVEFILNILQANNPKHKLDLMDNNINLYIQKLNNTKDKYLNTYSNKINQAEFILSNAKNDVNLHIEQYNSHINSCVNRLKHAENNYIIRYFERLNKANLALSNAKNNINLSLERSNNIVDNLGVRLQNGLENKIKDIEITIDKDIEKLQNLILAHINEAQNKLNILTYKLNNIDLNSVIDQKEKEYLAYTHRSKLAFIHIISKEESKALNVINKLIALNPLNILQRGYSFTKDSNDKAIRFDSVKNGDVITTLIDKATITSTVTAVHIEK